MRLLVVEDNLRLAVLLQAGLQEAGFAVEVRNDGLAGLSAATSETYDAIVLDWMLPGIDGIEVLSRLRNGGDRTPVLMLTARDAQDAKVLGLDRGADDYLVKPFDFAELVARIRALVRRGRGAASNVVVVADLEVDTVARRVTRAGHPLDLSAREYAVLECLAQNRGRIVDRERLVAHVYDHAAEIESNVIDVYVAALRKKVDRDFAVKLIHTRRGLGYLLEELPI